MKKFIIMNMLSGAVEIVVAKSYWKAMDKAKAFFGSNSKVKVWEDRLSSQLS